MCQQCNIVLWAFTLLWIFRLLSKSRVRSQWVEISTRGMDKRLTYGVPGCWIFTSNLHTCLVALSWVTHGSCSAVMVRSCVPHPEGLKHLKHNLHLYYFQWLLSWLLHKWKRIVLMSTEVLRICSFLNNLPRYQPFSGFLLLFCFSLSDDLPALGIWRRPYENCEIPCWQRSWYQHQRWSWGMCMKL